MPGFVIANQVPRKRGTHEKHIYYLLTKERSKNKRPFFKGPTELNPLLLAPACLGHHARDALHAQDE